MLESLITSKTRVKLLYKFFVNTETEGYLRGLADEFGESSNAVRTELNHLTTTGFLVRNGSGRNIVYRANTAHAMFSAIQNLVKSFLGIDKIEYFISRLGNVEKAYLTGDYARGNDSGIIDIVLVGSVNKEYLARYTEKTEEIIHRKIRSLVLTPQEFTSLQPKLEAEKAVLIWSAQN